MLKIIRRVFDFNDWARSHPRDPVPGDMLDAQFTEIIDQIDAWDARVKRAVRDDGKIAPGAVETSALSDELRDRFASQVREAVRPDIAVIEAARDALIAKAEAAEHAAKLAIQAVAGIQAQLDDIRSARHLAERDIAEIHQDILAADLLLEKIDAKADETESHEGYSEAWAESSRLWAEHMPDTLPDNALKMMDISGDHWSARWWANKADNAFGRLTDLYLGAWPEPPTTNLEGGPIEVGSIYYDTDPPPGQMYVWDGANWQSMTSPQRAAVATLWYAATAGQTVFPLTTLDLYGHNYTIDAVEPEPLNVYANGVKLMPLAGGLGDWTIAASTVTFERPLRVDDLISFDIFMPDSALGPGAVQAWKLAPLTGKDGVKVAFALATLESPGVPVTVSKNEELLVSLDGVIQEPGVGYVASGATITFSPAPAADAYTFITWFRPI